jgi:hypothetical protein
LTEKRILKIINDDLLDIFIIKRQIQFVIDEANIFHIEIIQVVIMFLV